MAANQTWRLDRPLPVVLAVHDEQSGRCTVEAPACGTTVCWTRPWPGRVNLAAYGDP